MPAQEATSCTLVSMRVGKVVIRLIKVLYEGCEGDDEDDRGVSMRVAKVVIRLTGVLYEVGKGDEKDR